MSNLIATHGSNGLNGQEKLANEKANKIYEVLDAYPEVYKPVNDKSYRSRMNICFRCSDVATEKEFLQEAEEVARLVGLKGHRSVGGIRISNYVSNIIHHLDGLSWDLRSSRRYETLGLTLKPPQNAVPMEHINRVVVFLIQFAREKR